MGDKQKAKSCLTTIIQSSKPVWHILVQNTLHPWILQGDLTQKNWGHIQRVLSHFLSVKNMGLIRIEFLMMQKSRYKCTKEKYRHTWSLLATTSGSDFGSLAQIKINCFLGAINFLQLLILGKDLCLKKIVRKYPIFLSKACFPQRSILL